MPRELITPEAFTDEENLPLRMGGFEMEYTVYTPSGVQGEDAILSPDVFRRARVGAWSHRVYDRDFWLYNGARAYPDLDHLEYCIPESLGARQMVAADKAGQLLVARLAQTAGGDDLRVYRRSGTTDTRNGRVTTKGFHINAIMAKEFADPREMHGLVSHMATRFYGWSGIVGRSGYVLSQKCAGVGNEGIMNFSELGSSHHLTTARAKAMGLIKSVNDSTGGFARFEDRSGDPGTEWSDFMAAATNSLLLRIIEHPHLANRDGRPIINMLDDVWLDRPGDVMRHFAADPTFRATAETPAGDLTALDIQEKLLEAVVAMSEQIELPEEELYAIEEWKNILNDTRRAVELKDWSAVAGRMRFAAKLHALKKRMSGQLMFRNYSAVAYDLDFDRTHPNKKGKGGGRIYDERLGVRIVTASQIGRLISQPPRKTSASARVATIRAYPPGAIIGISWNEVRTFADPNDTSENHEIHHTKFNPYSSKPRS